MENMDTILKAVGINPMTLEMVMKADAMITIYEDIDHQWKILQETSIIAKSLRGYRTRNFKMTANKFKLDVPKPEVVDDWDLRQVKIYINKNIGTPSYDIDWFLFRSMKIEYQIDIQ